MMVIQTQDPPRPYQMGERGVVVWLRGPCGFSASLLAGLSCAPLRITRRAHRPTNYDYILKPQNPISRR